MKINVLWAVMNDNLTQGSDVRAMLLHPINPKVEKSAIQYFVKAFKDSVLSFCIGVCVIVFVVVGQRGENTLVKVTSSAIADGALPLSNKHAHGGIT